MKYDLAVIGGGASGLMAAHRASELGHKVIVIEKNPRLGVKLLITGGGRCNVTNNIPDYRLMATNFGAASSFLLSAFSRFGVLETIDFFESRNVKLKTENDNKVFPVSDIANDILNVLVDGIKEKGGVIQKSSPVSDLTLKNNKIEKAVLLSGEEILADNFLIATGGLSYPGTGSSGDGHLLLEKLGHTIKPLRPALTRISTKEKFVYDLEGLSLENVVLNLYLKNKKVAKEQGAIIFTATGLSGPAAINISRFVDFKFASNYRLEIDLQPEYLKEELDKKLLSIISTSNKFLKNSLEEFLPARLAETILILAGLKVERMSNSISREERKKLVEVMKLISLQVKSIEGFDRAMVTVGGVDLKEVDSKTMRSKIISNLFLAGEVLDIAGPTGGYNLQSAWSTGWVAGDSI
ncbi:MAG: aminoacetone oxidase family FAD-binding enzyme [Patescibacteria group bacterium]